MDYFRGGVFDCFVIVNDCVRGPLPQNNSRSSNSTNTGPCALRGVHI